MQFLRQFFGLVEVVEDKVRVLVKGSIELHDIERGLRKE